MMNHGLRREAATMAGLASAGLFMARQKPWALALGLCAAGLSLLPTPVYSFKNRSVIITGGSRGLGLALAENFLREGAYVTLLARDSSELERAKDKLEEISAEFADHDSVNRIQTITCDVTQPQELALAIEKTEQEFGRIDVLVNNAGTISVGPFETMDQSDFAALMDLQLHAVVNAIQLVLPALRRSGGGRIVNISSIGGQLAVPHMSTYCAGKFALAGLSETIAAELAPDNIRVTTVYPGLMRTGSPIQAVFKGDCEKEYAWFSAGDVTPGLSVSAQSAARKIINGVRNGDARVSYPMVTNIGIMGHAVFPETYAAIMRQAARFMPKSDSTLRKTGAESQGWVERQVWYKPFKGALENAETKFNQEEKFDADFNLGVKSFSS